MEIEVDQIIESKEGGIISGMTRYIWNFRIKGRGHTIELRLLPMGKKQVFVDGQIRVDDRVLIAGNVKYPIEVDNQYFFVQKDEESFDVCLQSNEWICFKRLRHEAMMRAQQVQRPPQRQVVLPSVYDHASQVKSQANPMQLFNSSNSNSDFSNFNFQKTAPATQNIPANTISTPFDDILSLGGDPTPFQSQIPVQNINQNSRQVQSQPHIQVQDPFSASNKFSNFDFGKQQKPNGVRIFDGPVNPSANDPFSVLHAPQGNQMILTESKLHQGQFEAKFQGQRNLAAETFFGMEDFDAQLERNKEENQGQTEFDAAEKLKEFGNTLSKSLKRAQKAVINLENSLRPAEPMIFDHVNGQMNPESIDTFFGGKVIDAEVKIDPSLKPKQPSAKETLATLIPKVEKKAEVVPKKVDFQEPQFDDFLELDTPSAPKKEEVPVDFLSLDTDCKTPFD